MKEHIHCECDSCTEQLETYRKSAYQQGFRDGMSYNMSDEMRGHMPDTYPRLRGCTCYLPHPNYNLILDSKCPIHTPK